MDAESEQEEQAFLEEPSSTPDRVGSEADETEPESDIQSESGGRGWTKLAQILWDRLKKLVKKGRKRTEPNLNLDAQWA